MKSRTLALPRRNHVLTGEPCSLIPGWKWRSASEGLIPPNNMASELAGRDLPTWIEAELAQMRGWYENRIPHQPGEDAEFDEIDTLGIDWSNQ